MPRILRHIVITLLCFSAAAAASAQTDALLSQAYAVPTYYNPGFAGSTDMLRIRPAVCSGLVSTMLPRRFSAQPICR